MNRRAFLAGLALTPFFPSLAFAERAGLSVGIFPGTGTADMFLDEFRDAALPFSRALVGALGLEPRLTMFRSIKSTVHSHKNRQMDLYFVPPTIAANMLDNGYVPVARVADTLTGALVRRKGATVTTIALPEKESFPDVMGRYVLKRNSHGAGLINLKTQEDVVIAMARDHAQAGGLNSKFASELVAKGTYELWHPLPSTLGYTLMASNRLDGSAHNRLSAAAVAVKPETLQAMQKAFSSKIGGFVPARQADFSVVKRALTEAGYS